MLRQYIKLNQNFAEETGHKDSPEDTFTQEEKEFIFSSYSITNQYFLNIYPGRILKGTRSEKGITSSGININYAMNNEKFLLTRDEIELLSKYGEETPAMEVLLMQAKIKYVDERHTASIQPMKSGVQKGRWKTYWGHGKTREPITRSSKGKIYEELYKRYKAQESREKTLSEVFEILEQYKKDCLGRSEKTLSEDRRLFNHLPEEIQFSPISGISDEDIQKNLISTFNSKHPTTSAMKKTIQVLDQIFRYGIKKKFCSDNPMTSIDVGEYGKYCNSSQKESEKKQFSDTELSIITSDCWNNWNKSSNPRALMALLAKETGMRAGELPAFHKEDIVGDYLHVHRQQIHDGSQKPEVFYEVQYTKDEKMHPHDGRLIPITKEARQIIDEAMKIPGDSVYLFHEKNKAEAITKGSYCQNLRNRTKRLGTLAHNNHAFRMSFNARLIDLGFSPSERALILGHEVQTNENNYSLTDKRRLEDIKSRLVNAKEK